MIDAVILISYLIGFFVLPPMLLVSSAIRLIFGWHSSRRDMGLALVLALPQSVQAVARTDLKGTILYGEGPLWVGMGLTLAGVFFWLRAVRRTSGSYFALEAVLLVVVPIAQILTVNNWIAH